MIRTKLTHTALLVLVCCGIQAQSDLQNNGILFISGGSDILYISGAFTNASGAALTNNGGLYIGQTLTNGQSSMTIGTGTLYLNGTSAQSVSGAQPFKTFNFVSNNSAGITLNNDLSVSGTHTFTLGIIASSATPNYLIYEAGSSYTGDGDAQHVSGWVRKIGATNFVYPVGNNTVERVIGLSSLSASSTFNVKYAGATTNTGNLNSPLVSVNPAEYWQVNQVSGGTAQVAMNWNNSKVAFPGYTVADIRVANYIAAKWTSIGGSASGNATTTGTITSSTVGAFGSFVLGSISAALPVELLDFSARRTSGYNLVAWTTASEINVQRYEVLRSDDGRSFYLAGTTPARNLPSVQHYEWPDNKPMGNIAYYRLRSVDADGQYKISGIVTVYERASTGNYFAVANPVHGLLNISAGNMHSGNYEYHIMTAGGQTVQAGRLSIINGGNYQVSLLAVIVHGIYIVEFRKDGFNYRERVLVQ
jgi:hypothetical protein